MKEVLYRIIKDYIGKDTFLIKKGKGNILYFMKDGRTGFSVNCYRIINGNHSYQCNGSIIEDGEELIPFFFNSKKQFICNILYNEENNIFNNDDILNLYSYLKKFYIRFYIKPYLKEKYFNLKTLVFFQLSTNDLLELRYFLI